MNHTNPASQNCSINSKTAQAGVTLIELMVALAVSSFILLGISNIYVATKKSYVVQDEFARIQENGRFAVETLSSNIRNSGYFGCASAQGLGNISNVLKQDEKPEYNFQTGVMGYEADGTDIDETKIITMNTTGVAATDWKTAAGLASNGTAIVVNPDAAIVGKAVAGSDILVIRTTSNTGVKIDKNNSGAQFFAVNPSGAAKSGGCISGICDNDIIMVSNCAKSVIFQVTNLAPTGTNGSCDTAPAPAKCFNVVHSTGNNTPGNESATWANDDFGPGSEVISMVTKTYFVGVPTSGGDPSLYVRENAGTPEPLVEGIENMQILYGVDTDTIPDGIANKYVSADAANDLDLDGDPNTVFDAVVSVKISLLVRTPNDLPGTGVKRDYSKLVYKMVSPVSPITINPFTNGANSTDRHLRKIYNLTIKIRNKSFNTAIESS